MKHKFSLINVKNTNEASLLKSSLYLGELVYDIETGYVYCMSNFGKYSFVVNEEDAPCLGSQCPKRKYCFKYNEAKKFSKEDFIICDLSVDTYETDFGLKTYCNADNRYIHFRWN